MYLDRARMYYTYAQVVTLGILCLKSFGVPIKSIYVILGVPALVLVSVVLGWLDYKIGFFQEEAKRHATLNPINMETLQRIKDIQGELAERLKAPHC